MSTRSTSRRTTSTAICAAPSARTFSAVVPNFRVMEIDIDSAPWRDEFYTIVPTIENGDFILPTGPGWGIDINEKAVRARPPTALAAASEETDVAKFKIATPAGASFTAAGGGYDYEMEPLEGIDAEIVEGPTDEDGFIKFAPGCRRDLCQGHELHQEVIEACRRTAVRIVLGSVGVDSVDVAAATARGIPVTNCPDTFIEEVADHAMMLLLAGIAALSSRTAWCAKAAGAKAARPCCRSPA